MARENKEKRRTAQQKRRESKLDTLNNTFECAGRLFVERESRENTDNKREEARKSERITRRDGTNREREERREKREEKRGEKREERM